jgi:hypothetical protein
MEVAYTEQRCSSHPTRTAAEAFSAHTGSHQRNVPLAVFRGTNPIRVILLQTFSEEFSFTSFPF